MCRGVCHMWGCVRCGCVGVYGCLGCGYVCRGVCTMSVIHKAEINVRHLKTEINVSVLIKVGHCNMSNWHNTFNQTK